MSKAFAVTLQDLRDGRTHAEMTEKFAQLIKEFGLRAEARILKCQIG